MLYNSSILITGGTGSFGNSFVPLTLNKYNPKRIIIYSRDEMKQWEMAQKFNENSNVEFIIGDVRDYSRLRTALQGIDFVVHAAATKIVPTAEVNPSECIKTNIDGAMNLIDACISCGIKRVVALSTDKACNPINLYGATKLASDKLFIASNSFSGKHFSKFSVVRYGNVLESRGSVIPYFRKMAKTGEIPITDPTMSRFMITLDQAVQLVWKAFDEMIGGEIFVKKLPSMNLLDIAEAVAPGVKRKIIGIRPGEKIHEQMIGKEDSDTTYSYDGFYIIYPKIHVINLKPEITRDGLLVSKNFEYSSNTNDDWMTIEQLRRILKLKIFPN